MRIPTKVVWCIAAAVLAITPSPAAAKPDPEVIDLNRASLEELLDVPGIGRLYAAKIVAARPFASRSELVKRDVLPIPVYLAIKHRLFVTNTAELTRAEEASRVPDGMADLNRATLEELLAVPGVGRAYAGRIVSGRPYRDELELVTRRIMPLAAFRRIEGRVAVPR